MSDWKKTIRIRKICLLNYGKVKVNFFRRHSCFAVLIAFFQNEGIISVTTTTKSSLNQPLPGYFECVFFSSNGKEFPIFFVWEWITWTGIKSSTTLSANFLWEVSMWQRCFLGQHIPFIRQQNKPIFKLGCSVFFLLLGEIIIFPDLLYDYSMRHIWWTLGRLTLVRVYLGSGA